MSRKTGNITLHTDLIRWEPFHVPRSVGYAWIKTLSKDEETGARTALIRYEPGFRAEASTSAWPIDMYVLEGSMHCGDRTYNQDTYHYRLADAEIGPTSTQEGITRLVFTADEQDPARSSPDEVFVQNVVTDLTPDPPFHFAPESAGEAGPDARFGAAETAREMFDHGHLPADPATLQGAREHKGERWRKILRLDPIANMAVRAQRVHKVGVRDCVEKMHMHPWSEEAFLIRGNNQDYDHNIEGHWLWHPGTYVCRQPGTCMHGDATKLDDDYYMIVRSGWTADPEQAAVWRAWQDANEVPVPAISFRE
jgi:hypothetical protein